MDSQSILAVRLTGPSGAAGVLPFVARTVIVLAIDPIALVLAFMGMTIQAGIMLGASIQQGLRPPRTMAFDLAEGALRGFHLAAVIVVLAAVLTLVRRFSGRLLGMLRQLRLAGLSGRRMLLSVLAVSALIAVVSPPGLVLFSTLSWATWHAPRALVLLMSVAATPALMTSLAATMVAVAEERRPALRALLLLVLWAGELSLFVAGFEAAERMGIGTAFHAPVALSAYALLSLTMVVLPWLERLGRRL